ncbi:Tre1 family protein [Schizosaccharomyces japonicus yFS275]|uniref:Tre1 family protein n=1 Tax=Schizosaccharomyces japonicus (strain yFS275 / FY16936) TaxID=402676 RepID=B6K1K6_SCHJY|nr:Tre1 family protein [Schizosaccharomyces japonicus yFS275]EEB07037.1 Tre1 family protein [Schizosaccharomyces japonicus yFS275]
MVVSNPEKSRNLYVPRPSPPPSYEEVEVELLAEVPPVNSTSLGTTPVHHFEVEEPPSPSRLARYPRLQKKLEDLHEGWASVRHSFNTRCLPLLRRIPFHLLYLFLVAIVLFITSYYGFSDETGVQIIQHYDEEYLVSYLLRTTNWRIGEYLPYFANKYRKMGTIGDNKLAEMMLYRLRYLALDNLDLNTFYTYAHFTKPPTLEVVDDSSFHALVSEIPIQNSQQEYDAVISYTYSADGNVTAPLVYVNTGTDEDYSTLDDLNIQYKGAIVILRATRDKVRQAVWTAERHGAVGCLVYDETLSAGFASNAWYPTGPFAKPDTIFRTSLARSYYYMGDPLTPGFASTYRGKRLDRSTELVTSKIPALPLSQQNAQELMLRLVGRGHHIQTDAWKMSLPGVQNCWTGLGSNSEGEPLNVHIQTNMNYEVDAQSINVLAEIEGMDRNEFIVVGAPRDSYDYDVLGTGLASASLMNLIEVFTEMRSALSWRPRRTIVFASWDGRMYNALGSTEWLEQFEEELQGKIVAYVNVDVAFKGSRFTARTVPGLQKIVKRSFSIARRNFPSQDGYFMTDDFDIGPDYTSFLSHSGIPVINIGFERDSKTEPDPLLGSILDSKEWLTTYESGYEQYVNMLTEVWALILLSLSNDPIVPFSLADEVDGYASFINRLSATPASQNIDFSSISEELQALKLLANNYTFFLEKWVKEEGHSMYLSTNRVYPELKNVNQLLMSFERAFTDPVGLPGHEWYKHVIYGPNIRDQKPFVLPSVYEQLWIGNYTGAQQELDRVSRAIQRATELFQFS